LDIHGTILAVAHGHQANNPDRIPQWWANQVHGGQPAADADILLTAHFHHLRVQPTGRNPHSGDRKSTRLNSSHVKISYAVFCLTRPPTPPTPFPYTTLFRSPGHSRHDPGGGARASGQQP